MRKLPPLNGLRAFEAAARHLSISLAAAELYVTPGAVSQQVKALESHLGVRLFHRHNRQIELTEAARMLLPGVTEGFDRISGATNQLKQRQRNQPLTVTMSPTFGARWLVPRLQRFQAAYPDINVRIDATAELVDLHQSEIDLGIRFGGGRYDGLESECLLEQSVFPVCSPDLLDEHMQLNEPEDLFQFTLLHGDYPFGEFAWPDWSNWFQTVGVDYREPSGGLRFTQPDLIIQAAIAGQGVALAGSVAVDSELDSGRLMKPFTQAIVGEFSYYLVWSAEKANRPELVAFRAWLIEETAHYRNENDRSPKR
ncbi:MAG: transcriptional regulator GcvA [Pseudomonadota bacterium]